MQTDANSPSVVPTRNATSQTPPSIFNGNQIIFGGTFNLNHFNDSSDPEHPRSGKGDPLERVVNAIPIRLNGVKLTPKFCANIGWDPLPAGFKIKFSKPVAIKYNGDHVLNAVVDEIASENVERQVPLFLPDEETGRQRFRSFASDILKRENVTVKLEGEFQSNLLGVKQKLDRNISFKGMNSLRDAVILDNVKIRRRVPGGLLGSVKATITNLTSIDLQTIKLLSMDVLYHSTKIGYYKNEPFPLRPGANTDGFRWIFTPPSVKGGDHEFRAFISQFLTSTKDIPILLDLKNISIKIGNREVVLDGVKVDTTVKGLGQSLISRVDVYLGTNVLRQEVSFRFKLVNPIHAPIEVIDFVAEATFNGQLLSYIKHSFRDFAIPTIGEEKESELVTAKLDRNLLSTILLVQGRTAIKLGVHIKSTTISIDGYPIPKLEFKLQGVECRIHFGQPLSCGS